jgi:hypothetical protein
MGFSRIAATNWHVITLCQVPELLESPNATGTPAELNATSQQVERTNELAQAKYARPCAMPAMRDHNDWAASKPRRSACWSKLESVMPRRAAIGEFSQPTTTMSSDTFDPRSLAKVQNGATGKARPPEHKFLMEDSHI